VAAGGLRTYLESMTPTFFLGDSQGRNVTMSFALGRVRVQLLPLATLLDVYGFAFALIRHSLAPCFACMKMIVELYKGVLLLTVQRGAKADALKQHGFA